MKHLRRYNESLDNNLLAKLKFIFNHLDTDENLDRYTKIEDDPYEFDYRYEDFCKIFDLENDIDIVKSMENDMMAILSNKELSSNDIKAIDGFYNYILELSELYDDFLQISDINGVYLNIFTCDDANKYSIEILSSLLFNLDQLESIFSNLKFMSLRYKNFKVVDLTYKCVRIIITI